MQIPHFRERGLDLGGYHPATLNLSIAPFRFEILQPKVTFREVKWHATEPEEDFSFFDCRLRFEERISGVEPCPRIVEGLIYFPHPETKPEHFQEDHVLEVIARSFVPGVEYGNRLVLETDPEQIRFFPGNGEESIRCRG